MTSVKGYEHIPPELVARLATVAPDLWASHPKIALSFAFGPPEGVDLSWLEQFVVKDEVEEFLSDPSASEDFFERLAAALTPAALEIAEKRHEKFMRMRHACKAKDTEAIQQIGHELVGMRYEKEKGNRTYPRIH
jgi:hypothetical protein